MKDFKRQETFARQKMRAPMASSVRLTNELLRLGVRIVQSKDEHYTASSRAAFFLASRMLNEVRCCELLAQTGYPIQALALAASAFELAYRATYLRNDDTRAKTWATHADLRYSYPKSLLEAVQDYTKASGGTAAQGETVYRNRYQPLAAAKHGNPKALAQFGLVRDGEVLRIFLGPVVESATIKACKIALVESNRLLITVLADLVKYHLADRVNDFDEPLTRIFRRVQKLGLSLQS